jgi:hypothetical protein
MVTFDDVLGTLVRTCEEHEGFSAVDKAVVVRDLRGRVRLTLQPAQSPAWIGSLSSRLKQELGAWFEDPILGSDEQRELGRLRATVLGLPSAPWRPDAYVDAAGQRKEVAPGRWHLVERHLSKLDWLGDAKVTLPWPLAPAMPSVVTFYSFKGVDAGLFPGPMPESEQARFARALAGESMGKGPKKGYVYRWIPARLKDAGGAIVPRSFTRLLGYAARRQRDVGPRKSGPLMDPPQLVGALDDTSIDRVAELQDEYVVVGRLENLRNLTLLLDEEEVQARLSVAAKKDGYKNDGAAVVEELRRIGVLQFRADGRVDIPDIYRYGYGIKRRGGAARPR